MISNIRYILDGQTVDGEVSAGDLGRIVHEIRHDLAEKYSGADVDVSVGWGVPHSLFIDGEIHDDDYQTGPGAVIDRIWQRGKWHDPELNRDFF